MVQTTKSLGKSEIVHVKVNVVRKSDGQFGRVGSSPIPGTIYDLITLLAY